MLLELSQPPAIDLPPASSMFSVQGSKPDQVRFPLPFRLRQRKDHRLMLYKGKKKRNMNLSLILFLIGILGFVLNKKNIILMLMSIEIMLLAVTVMILVSSFSFDDILGQTYAIYIIVIAGAESAIGLGILVAYYRLRGTIAIQS